MWMIILRLKSLTYICRRNYDLDNLKLNEITIWQSASGRFIQTEGDVNAYWVKKFVHSLYAK